MEENMSVLTVLIFGLEIARKKERITYQTRMNPVHDSTSRAQASTTQYMSHGVKRAGSEVLRALYEAKTGKRKVAMLL